MTFTLEQRDEIERLARQAVRRNIPLLRDVGIDLLRANTLDFKGLTLTREGTTVIIDATSVRVYDSILDDINDVLDVIAAGSRSILLLDGDHIVNGDLNVTTAGVEITGETRGGCIVHPGANTISLQATGVALRRFTIKDGTNATTGAVNIAAAAGRPTIDDLVFDGNVRALTGGGQFGRVRATFLNFAGGATDAYMMVTGNAGPIGMEYDLVCSGGYPFREALSSGKMQVCKIRFRWLISANQDPDRPGCVISRAEVVQIHPVALMGSPNTPTTEAGLVDLIGAPVTQAQVVAPAAYGQPGIEFGFVVRTSSPSASILGGNATHCRYGAILRASRCLVDGSSFSTGAGDGVLIDGDYDRCRIQGATLRGFTGYGVNISSALADATQIRDSDLAGNSAGSVNDLGTGTKQSGNLSV